MTKHKNKFKKSKKDVQELNSAAKDAEFALNFFADMDDEELVNYFGSFDNVTLDETLTLPDLDLETHGRLLEDIPINWVELGHTTPVKAQGTCGACVAFTMATVMESLISIKETAENGGDRVAPSRISEQHMVDCARSGAINVSRNYYNYGCDGGYIHRYADFVLGEGVVAYDDYRPYEGKHGVCEHNPADVVIKAAEDGQIRTTIQDAVLQLHKGPMPVSLASHNIAVLFYRSGILDETSNCPEVHTHTMVIVGFGIDVTETVIEPATTKYECRSANRREIKKKRCFDRSTFDRKAKTCCSTVTVDAVMETTEKPYWLLQNSWGKDWGEDGFMRIAVTGGNGICGINKNLRWVNLPPADI